MNEIQCEYCDSDATRIIIIHEGDVVHEHDACEGCYRWFHESTCDDYDDEDAPF